MSKTLKIILIVIGSLVGLCVVFVLISSQIVDKRYLASTYGVSDKNRSVLVVENSSVFYILKVTLSGEADKTWEIIILPSDHLVKTISPGEYTIAIYYSDHQNLDSIGGFDWYVSSHKSTKFSVMKGRAVIFSLEGGHTSGIMYTPPDLEEK
jgi:hypothetical protein